MKKNKNVHQLLKTGLPFMRTRFLHMKKIDNGLKKNKRFKIINSHKLILKEV